MPGSKIEIERVFHALGDPTRRRIFEMICERPTSVSRLAAAFDVTLTAVGQHLQVLEESGLVRTEKVGRVRTCSVETAGLDALQKWLDDRRSLWERRLGRLGEVLADEERTE